MTEPSTSWQFDTITYAGGSQDGPRASVQLTRQGKQVTPRGPVMGLSTPSATRSHRPQGWRRE